MKMQDIIVLPVDDGIINKTVNNAIKNMTIQLIICHIQEHQLSS